MGECPATQEAQKNTDRLTKKVNRVSSRSDSFTVLSSSLYRCLLGGAPGERKNERASERGRCCFFYATSCWAVSCFSGELSQPLKSVAAASFEFQCGAAAPFSLLLFSFFFPLPDLCSCDCALVLFFFCALACWALLHVSTFCKKRQRVRLISLSISASRARCRLFSIPIAIRQLTSSHQTPNSFASLSVFAFGSPSFCQPSLFLDRSRFAYAAVTARGKESKRERSVCGHLFL